MMPGIRPNMPWATSAGNNSHSKVTVCILNFVKMCPRFNTHGEVKNELKVSTKQFGIAFYFKI